MLDLTMNYSPRPSTQLLLLMAQLIKLMRFNGQVPYVSRLYCLPASLKIHCSSRNTGDWLEGSRCVTFLMHIETIVFGLWLRYRTLFSLINIYLTKMHSEACLNGARLHQVVVIGAGLSGQ